MKKALMNASGVLALLLHVTMLADAAESSSARDDHMYAGSVVGVIFVAGICLTGCCCCFKVYCIQPDSDPTDNRIRLPELVAIRNNTWRPEMHQQSPEYTPLANPIQMQPQQQRVPFTLEPQPQPQQQQFQQPPQQQGVPSQFQPQQQMMAMPPEQPATYQEQQPQQQPQNQQAASQQQFVQQQPPIQPFLVPQTPEPTSPKGGRWVSAAQPAPAFASSTLARGPDQCTHVDISPSVYDPEDVEGKLVDRKSVTELCCLGAVWLLSLFLWYLVLFMMPFCAGAPMKVEEPTSTPTPATTTPGPEEGIDSHFCAWYELEFYGLVITVIVIYIVYLVFCCYSPSRVYLHKVEPSLTETLNTIAQAVPVRRWVFEAYHYDTRSERYTDSQGYTQTRSVEVKVNTYSSSKEWCYDVAEDWSSKKILEDMPGIMRLQIVKEVEFGDEYTKRVEESEFMVWAASEKAAHDDVRTTAYHGFVTPDLDTSSRLFLRDGESSRPCFFNAGWYWICSLLTFTVVFRHYFYWVSAPREHIVKKVCFRKQS